MVIQRWQSLFLLIAVILMCIFCCTPYAVVTASETEVTEIFAKDSIVFLIVNIVIAILLFISIFLFKNLGLQMRVTLLSTVLIAASIVTCGFILYFSQPDAELIWTGGVVLLVAALGFALWAHRRMKKDLRLLRSYDRLR